MSRKGAKRNSSVRMRNPELDLTKMVAIYLVVVGHLFHEAGYTAAGINMSHMPALFFLSGYLAFSSVRKHSKRELFKRKVHSLAVPYLIWSTVSFGANLMLALLQGHVDIQSATAEFVEIYFHARSVWFLLQLFAAFCVLLGCQYLSQHWKWNQLLVNGAVYMVLIWLLPNKLFDFSKLKWLYPFFLGGYLVAENKDKVQSCKYRRVLSTASLLYPIGIQFLVMPDEFTQYTTFTYKDLLAAVVGAGYYLLSALGIVLIFTIARLISRTKISGFLAEIGTYSLDIYVVHMFCIKLFPMAALLQGKSAVLVKGSLLVYAAVIVLGVFIAAKYLLRKMKLYCIAVGKGPA